MKEHRTALVWFRRDLRLTDNPALMYAVAHAEQIVPVYVHDEDGEWPIGAASAWWLHHSLIALDSTLSKRGSRLIVLHGPIEQTLPLLYATVLVLLLLTFALNFTAILLRARLRRGMGLRD